MAQKRASTFIYFNSGLDLALIQDWHLFKYSFKLQQPYSSLSPVLFQTVSYSSTGPLWSHYSNSCS